MTTIMRLLNSRAGTLGLLAVGLALGAYAGIEALAGDGVKTGAMIFAVASTAAAVRRLTVERTPASIEAMELLMGWGLVAGAMAVAAVALISGLRADDSGTIAVGVIAAVFAPVAFAVVVHLHLRARRRTDD